MLSVVIPSYKDPLLHKTIDSLLENAAGEIEIIAVLDGYWPKLSIKNDARGTRENPSNNESCWAYALNVWRDYFEKEIKPKWGI